MTAEGVDSERELLRELKKSVQGAKWEEVKTLVAVSSWCWVRRERERI